MDSESGKEDTSGPLKYLETPEALRASDIQSVGDAPRHRVHRRLKLAPTIVHYREWERRHERTWAGDEAPCVF